MNLSPQIEIQIIAAVVAVACALPGVFLVLRRMALMSDAISHAILLGIVLAFFVTEDLASPLLIVAAAITGVITVALVELLHGTGLVREDAAIGIVFPALFSGGVILISRYAGSVHLDTDAVLLGELAFAPFERLSVLGYSLPKSLWVMGGILLINLIFITLFYKELKLATFDAGLAAALGFSPVLVHYGLMTLVSVTAVGAFDAVGSILVVALMIAPPGDRLPADRSTILSAWTERVDRYCECYQRLLVGALAGCVHRRCYGNDEWCLLPFNLSFRTSTRSHCHCPTTGASAMAICSNNAHHSPAESRGVSRSPARASH